MEKIEAIVTKILTLNYSGYKGITFLDPIIVIGKFFEYGGIQVSIN